MKLKADVYIFYFRYFETPVWILSISLSHTHTRTLSYTHTRAHPFSFTHTCTNTHKHNLSLSHTHTLSHTHSLFLCLSHTHTLSELDTGGVPWLDWLGGKLATDKLTSEGIRTPTFIFHSTFTANSALFYFVLFYIILYYSPCFIYISS